jgi:hypothetical protein
MTPFVEFHAHAAPRKRRHARRFGQRVARRFAPAPRKAA